MAESQNNASKAAMSVLLALAIIAGSINAAGAVCANALPAGTATYCSGLSTAGADPCDSDPGCGSVTLASGQDACVPLDRFCCAVPSGQCYIPDLAGACKNGTTTACTSSSSALAPTTATTGTLPVTGTNTTTGSVPLAPTAAPAPAGGLAGVGLVNTTSNTVTVCYTVPIGAVVR